MNARNLCRYTAHRFAFWLLLVCLPLLFCGAFGLSHWWHDVQLQAFARRVMDDPLPPQTVVIKQEIHIGALVGLHDHCDYAVIRYLETFLSVEDIRTFYHDRVLAPVTIRSKRIPIQLQLNTQRSAEGKLAFSILTVDTDQPKGLELRCR